MAAADYYPCDKCGAKTFYDAELTHKHEDGTYIVNRTTRHPCPVGAGSMAVLCEKCAETHTIQVVANPSDALLRKAALAVVNARHYNGDDGWDKLKNAIAELEGIVGRSKK